MPRRSSAPRHVATSRAHTAAVVAFDIVGHSSSTPTFAALFRDVIYEAGRRLGKLKKELARDCGIRPDLLSQLQSGRRRPRRTTILAVARGLLLDQTTTNRLLLAAGFSELDDGEYSGGDEQLLTDAPHRVTTPTADVGIDFTWSDARLAESVRAGLPAEREGNQAKYDPPPRVALSPQEAERLFSAAERRTFVAREAIFYEGDAPNALHLIVSGRLASSVTSRDGKQLLFDVMGSGEVFGDLGLLPDDSDSQHSATVRALEQTVTRVLRQAEFERRRREDLALDHLLNRVLRHRVLRLSHQLQEALYLPAEQRVLRRLVDLEQAWNDGSGTTVVGITQDELADLAGTARATVNGILQNEAYRRTLEVQAPGRIAILDLDALKRRAAGARPSGNELTDPAAADQQRLRDAIERGNGLEALYWAKRLMLVNREDRDATSALTRVSPRQFRDHPILGRVDTRTLRKLIEAGELIELRRADILCRRGDLGSSLFLVLRGKIGVFGKDGEPLGSTHPEGDIVGELALALQRPRTADLVAESDAAVLSFDYERLAELLHGQGEMIWEFMTRRALEHVSQNVPYLAGRPLGSLPEPARREWQELLSILQSSCHIITREPHRRVSLADIRRRDRVRTSSGGIYILASGHLRSISTEGKELDGETFPLLYVDLPDLLVAPDHEYVVENGPAKIIFIGLEAIDQLPGAPHRRLVSQLKLEAQSLYNYDAFIAYNFEDEPAARRWQEALERAGLRVFRDRAYPGSPYAERDSAALLDSLTMLVLCSKHAQRKDADRNWLMKEVAFRRLHFDQPRIVPVTLPGGDPQALQLFYAAIRTENREVAAIEEATALIRAIRKGDEEPPYGLRRQAGTPITG